jgi:RNA repair pathway DNA polymerase beta family
VIGVDLIVEMRFGSHLYGTDTPESDVDVKGVYLPEARDILLQRVPPSVTASRDKGAGERNRPGDVDREYYSVQRYLGLLAAGQTVAIDMLFAPETAMTRPPSPCGARFKTMPTASSAVALRHSCATAVNKPTSTASRAPG